MCIGLNVARLEGRIAIGRFLARFANYALAGTPHPRRTGEVLRVPVALGVFLKQLD